MKITIIDYTEAQLAVMSVEQIKEIRSAEMKKIAFEKALAQALVKAKNELIDQGVYFSTLWKEKKEQLEAEYAEKIESVRESLLFYLHYYTESSNGGGGDSGDAQEPPYTVDYSLSEAERMAIVRDYYDSAYTDAAERHAAFAADNFAKTYLGELYAPLYDYFYDQIGM